jgi:hypothetical protein
MNKYLKALSKPGLVLFYLLILLEGVYMTSFFAVYLFSTYAPVQSLLEKSSALSCLTDFFSSALHQMVRRRRGPGRTVAPPALQSLSAEHS